LKPVDDAQGERHQLTRIQLPPGEPTDAQIDWFYETITAAFDRAKARRAARAQIPATPADEP
jgi:hypothetical protein